MASESKMQRTLVGLVVFLTAAVGALALAVFSLFGKLDERPLAQPSRVAARPVATPRDSADEAARSARLTGLERGQARLTSEIKDLKRRLERILSLQARRSAPAPVGASGNGSPLPPDSVAVGPKRDLLGNFIVAPEDEEYFMAVQKRVERRRRIDGMTRNLMRRIDRMEQNGDITALDPGVREKVETALRRYVVGGDDLVTKWVREPGEEIRAMSQQQRREEMGAERATIAEEAQRALEASLGPELAQKIGERVLQSSWGVRRGFKPRPR